MNNTAQYCSECSRHTVHRKSTPDGEIGCGKCGAAFSLDEIRTQFCEANLLDSNAARVYRRQIVDGLIEMVRHLQDVRP